MYSVKVRSLPLKEVIEDIAKEFSADFIDNCDEYILKVPSHLGEGSIRGITFPGGLAFVVYECRFRENLQVEFINSDVHPLKFLYVTEGHLNHKFENETEVHELDRYQSAIVASFDGNGHVLQFTADTKQCIYSVEVNRAVFKEKMECDLKTTRANLKEVFNDIYAENQFYHKGNYSLQIMELFTQMQKQYEDEQFIRKIFLESMTYQILAQQIIQYRDDIRNPEHNGILRASELERVRKVAFLIESNLAVQKTVEELAAEVGLNVNKLQEGFKILYHTTVNRYTQNARLQAANKLLLNTELNISEIVGMIGLSSKSYFSKIFKATYDISPSTLKKKNKAMALQD